MPLGRESFVGRWRIETQFNREKFLEAMEMPYMMRVALLSCTPPEQQLFFGSDDALHCHTGPVMGRVLEERFCEGHVARNTFRGVTTATEYVWEGRVLTSTTHNESTATVCRSRRWVAPYVHGKGSEVSVTGDAEMVIWNECTRRPGEAPVVSTRTYRRVEE